MESPIPDRLWKVVFHTTVCTLGAGIAISLWRQRNAERGILAPVLSELKKAKAPKDQLAAINEVLETITTETRSKKGISKLIIHDNFAVFVKLLKLNEDLSNAAVVEAILKLIQKTCTDAEGRHAFHKAGGYRRVLSCMSEGYKHGIRRIMEDAALTLQMLTSVEDSTVVLPSDVPFGAEGARSLCDYSSTVNMLRTLDPGSPIVFLNAATGVFANLCMLQAGSQKIGAGVDGTPAASFFKKLLNHGNPGVVEHCARAMRYLCRNDISHDLISERSTVDSFSNLLDPNKDPHIIGSVQTIILVMLDSKHSQKFFENLDATDAVQSLFLIWCRGPEKAIRDRAEVLIHLMERTGFCVSTIKKLTEQFRSQIMERKARDEEEKKKKFQQMKQQQAFQQMMMQQMGGGDMAGMMGGGEEEE